MTVSTRNTLLTGAVAVLALGGAAWAGGAGGTSVPGKGPGAMIPGAGMGTGKGSGCCNQMPKGQNVTIPGVNIGAPNISITTPKVNVHQGSVTIGGTSFVNTNIAVQGVVSGDGQTFVSTGGSYFSSSGVAPSAISNLNVTGGEETYTETITEQVPVTEETCVPQFQEEIAIRPVQAVCLDDKGTPHPASQISGDERVDISYGGEIYRCMAGTSMQVTIGNIENGTASFAQAETFSCAKGEALVHRPGGDLACAPQSPQRNCNERSLLRRNGPGIKLINTRVTRNSCIPTTRTVMQTVTRQVEHVRPVETGGAIVFDGGVGQGVF